MEIGFGDSSSDTDASGPELMELVFQAGMAYEIRQRGKQVEMQVAYPVIYNDVRVDAGLRMERLVVKLVIVDFKSVETMNPIDQA